MKDKSHSNQRFIIGNAHKMETRLATKPDISTLPLDTIQKNLQCDNEHLWKQPIQPDIRQCKDLFIQAACLKLDKFPYLRAKKAVTEGDAHHCEAKDIVPHHPLRKSHQKEALYEQLRGQDLQNARNAFLIRGKSVCDEERLTLMHARKMEGQTNKAQKGKRSSRKSEWQQAQYKLLNLKTVVSQQSSSNNSKFDSNATFEVKKDSLSTTALDNTHRLMQYQPPSARPDVREPAEDHAFKGLDETSDKVKRQVVRLIRKIRNSSRSEQNEPNNLRQHDKFEGNQYATDKIVQVDLEKKELASHKRTKSHSKCKTIKIAWRDARDRLEIDIKKKMANAISTKNEKNDLLGGISSISQDETMNKDAQQSLKDLFLELNNQQVPSIKLIDG